MGSTEGIPDEPIPPFSWDQTVVVREGGGQTFTIQAWDPGFNPVSVVRNTDPEIEEFTLEPTSNFVDFGTAEVLAWQKDNNRITVRVPPEVGALTDTLFFRVHVGGLSDNIAYPLNIDIRRLNDGRAIRSRPVLLRSQGVVTPPGHFVRLKWSKSARGTKDQEYKLEVSGRTQKAAELSGVPEAITTYRAFRFRPLVLGHYVAVVSPWDTEEGPFDQRAGSTSNGAIIYCRFGSENNPPVGDGLLASTFSPAVGESVTAIAPNSTDPETSASPATGFNGNVIDFGDGSPLVTFDGSTTHAFAEPGIYRARCLVKDFPVPDPPNSDIAPGPDGVAEDLFVVGAEEASVPGKDAAAVKVVCSLKKSIPPAEGGEGEPNKDKLTMSWKGVVAGAGDRLVFCLNRNRFGRMHTDPDPVDGEIDDRIILDGRRRWSGVTPNAARVQVAASRNGVKITISSGNLDRTADPRFGGAEKTGETAGHRIAVCVVPATYPSDPIRTYLVRPTDLLRYRVRGGALGGGGYDPEISLNARTARGP